MIKLVWYAILVFAAIVLHVSVIPAHIADPFKPNLLILFVVFMGLREGPAWGVLAFVLGLLQDSFSGLYLGLNAFSYLIIFLLFSLAAERLYTDRRSLMIIGTFSATMVSGLISLLLLLLFSSSHGIYSSLLEGLVPQSLVNALAASIVFTFTPFARMGDIR